MCVGPAGLAKPGPLALNAAGRCVLPLKSCILFGNIVLLELVMTFGRQQKTWTRSDIFITCVLTLFTFCLSLLGLVDEARQAGRWPLIESDMETDCNSQSTPGTSALKLYQKMAQFKFWPNFNWGLGHHLYYLRIFSPFLHCTNVYFVYCRCIF